MRTAQAALAGLAALLLLLSTILFTTETNTVFASVFAIAGLVITAALAGIIVYEARRQGQ